MIWHVLFEPWSAGLTTTFCFLKVRFFFFLYYIRKPINHYSIRLTLHNFFPYHARCCRKWWISTSAWHLTPPSGGLFPWDELSFELYIEKNKQVVIMPLYQLFNAKLILLWYLSIVYVYAHWWAQGHWHFQTDDVIDHVIPTDDERVRNDKKWTWLVTWEKGYNTV